VKKVVVIAGITLLMVFFLAGKVLSDSKPFPYKLCECTQYAASKRPDLLVFKSADGSRDAQYWDEHARRNGYPVVSYPAQGAIVVFEPGKKGAYDQGHVAYVEKVSSNGSFDISERGWGEGRTRCETHFRYNLQPEEGISFILSKPDTSAPPDTHEPTKTNAPHVTPTSTLLAEFTPFSCRQVQYQLHLELGIKVFITPQYGENRIRSSPSTKSKIITIAPPGAILTIIGGPVCAEGYIWWNIEGEGVTGWTAEGSGDQNWFTPVGMVSYAEANKIAAQTGRSYSGDIDKILMQIIMDILYRGGFPLNFTPKRYEDFLDHGIWINGGKDYLAVFVVHYPNVGSAFFEDRAGQIKHLWVDLTTLEAW
jgi:surface antigen